MAEDISPNRICEWRGAQANSCCSALCSILLVHRRWPGFSPPTYSSFQKPRSQKSHLAFSGKYFAPRRPFNPSFELCQIKCKNDGQSVEPAFAMRRDQHTSDTAGGTQPRHTYTRTITSASSRQLPRQQRLFPAPHCATRREAGTISCKQALCQHCGSAAVECQ
jgi:hypothetical protein